MSGHISPNGRASGMHHRRAVKNIEARFSPTASYPTPSANGLIPIPGQSDPSTTPKVATPTPDPKTSAPADNSSTTPATPASSTAPKAASTTVDPKSSSSSTTSSSSSTSAPGTSTSVSAASVPLSTSVAVVTPTLNAPTPTTPTGLNLQPSSTISSPSASSTHSSSDVHTGTVIGGVVGGLAALALIAFVAMWLVRRFRKDDEDEFNPDKFRRQSVMLVDDPPPPPMPSMYNPRPPTMIERHMNASPAVVTQQAFGQPNFYGNYPPPGQSFLPGDVLSHPGTPAPPPQAYSQHPMALGNFVDAAGVVRQPSNATGYVQRRPSNATAAFGAPPAVTEQHYLDLNRSSVSPFQAKQYAEISRQLSASSSHEGMGGVRSPPPPPVAAAAYVHSIPEEHIDLPSPFEDGHAAKTANTATSAPAPAAPAPVVDAKKADMRPVSTYTMYDEGDAYGGM